MDQFDNFKSCTK